MLERHEIEVFLTLVDELHFGRTAEKLHLSTARVSQTVTKLERRLGVPLFERSSRRVTATPAACALYADIRPAWDRIAAAVRHTIDTGHGRGGTLTVAFTDAATGQLLTRAAEYFNAELPDCTMRIREVPPAQAISRLRDGEIDIALDMLPVTDPDISTGAVLVEEARVLAVPAQHRWAHRRSITGSDLAGGSPPCAPAPRPPPTTNCSPSSARAGASRRCPRTPSAITPVPISPTSHSAAARPCAGACCGCPPANPPAFANSPMPQHVPRRDHLGNVMTTFPNGSLSVKYR
ncbi:LysR family transcriptional regulator [Nocardia crassostreae]|uniref:LysR family transcriptional regulator n=1 Tax=Nocardia crassostreae TaxID=53428 RepID=UPI001C3FAA87|nr:LysR family transcriptional regulator [Nocardia crassostreae]